MKIKKRHTYIILNMLIIIIVALFLLKFAKLDVTDILKHTPESPYLAAFLLVGLYCLKSVIVVIPLMGLYISAGFMFPTGWAFAVTCLGLFCEMSIGYFIGRWLGREKVKKYIEKNGRINRYLLGSKNIGPITCFLTKLLPLPRDPVNMFFGAVNVRYLQFIVTALLGSLPIMIPSVFAGKYISTPLSKKFLLPFIISIVISVCSLALYIHNRNRQKK